MPKLTKKTPVLPHLDKLLLGDCRDLLKSLPSECVDLVVSSPPYNIGKEYESRQELSRYLDEQKTVLAECARVLRSTGSIFWQVGSYSNQGTLVPLDIKIFPILEELGFRPRNRIIWVRQHGLHATRKFSARHESILWFTKSDEYTFNLDSVRVPQKWQNKRSYRGANKGELTCNPDGKNPGDIWVFQNVKHNHEEQTIHPAQFPEGLIARIVLASTIDGDIVLDPYMGTGTVAVVAKEHDRHFLGAELEEKYHGVALRRLHGMPDERGCFPNLKTLRRYVDRTGDSAQKYRFDVQIGKVASDSDKAKIYPEEHHAQQLMERLQYETDAFQAKLEGVPVPPARDLNGSGKTTRANAADSALPTLPLFEKQ